MLVRTAGLRWLSIISAALAANARLNWAVADGLSFDQNGSSTSQVAGALEDADFDLRDFAALQNCFSGTKLSAPLAPACLSPFDVNLDGNIDLADHAFKTCALLGPGVAVPSLVVCPPLSPTESLSVRIRGMSRWPQIEVSGHGKPAVFAINGAAFDFPIALRPDRVNRIFLTGISDSERGAPTTVFITHDSQPPTIFIDFPVNGAELTTDSADVAGRVGDMLSGAKGLSVVVNGVEAIVDVGIGNNGTFVRGNVPLQMGDNTIVAGTKDLLGNTAQTQITVKRVAIAEDVPRLIPLFGNGQAAAIGAFLPEKLVVKMTHADGTPFVNKLVTFSVTRSNGRLYGETAPDLDGPGTLTLQTHTDEEGLASALWKVGSDAGCGNNRIEVTSRDIAGSTFYCASALPAPARQINVGTGNNQQVETGALAPEPLRAWVSDSCNGARGIPVTFTVLQGGGKVNGHDQVTVNTSITGHADVAFTTGPEAGNNVIQADFPGNPGEPATFTIVGLKRDPLAPTQFRGIVLDNSSNPIQDATLRLLVNGDLIGETESLTDGRFIFDDIPATGPADLFVDGSTATHIGGEACTDPEHCDVEPGTFPFLHFEMLLVPNTVNSIGMPVLLPRLNPNNRRTYTGRETADVELTCEGMEGLKMIVKRGTKVTLPDGTFVPDPNRPNAFVTLALNQVHYDDVPMPMPDGAAPPFAWTLQPGGAHFDPPVQIEYPNMSGLPAGAISFFLSFNHDTGRFEIIGGGHVSEDGATIHSDPGVGITTAGWGCNCPPYSVTATCSGCTPSAATTYSAPPCCCVPGPPSSFDTPFPPFGLGPYELAGIEFPRIELDASLHYTEYRTCCPEDCLASGCRLDGHARLKALLEGNFEGAVNLNLLRPIDFICEQFEWLGSIVECDIHLNWRIQKIDVDGLLSALVDHCEGDSQWSGDLRISADGGVFGSIKLKITDLELVNIGLSGTVAIFGKFETRGGSMPGQIEVTMRFDSVRQGLVQNLGSIAIGPFRREISLPAVPACTALQVAACDANSEPITDHEEIDSAWLLRVGEQSVRANVDGTWTIGNVRSPDSFGVGGPGTPPDFLSDDFIRVLGTRAESGKAGWAFSDPFRIRQGEDLKIPPLTITDVPPPLPEEIEVSAPATRVRVGETVQLRVLATLRDGEGKDKDVTERRFWTIYRTSNPAVATVGENGLVTGHKVGTAYITATNEGASSVVGIGVVSDILATTVEGFVHVGTRTPVPNATVGVVCKLGNLWEVAGSAITRDDGSFSIPVEVAVNDATVLITVTGDFEGDVYLASIAAPVFTRNGYTDAGAIKVRRLATEVSARSFSVYNDVFQHTPVDVIGREFSVYVAPINDPLSDVMSREFSVYNEGNP